MIRKLNKIALSKMEGQKVFVYDITFDRQYVCEVKLIKDYSLKTDKSGHLREIIRDVYLHNEECDFFYDGLSCKNGEFEVYTYNRANEGKGDIYDLV